MGIDYSYYNVAKPPADLVCRVLTCHGFESKTDHGIQGGLSIVQ